MPHDPNAQFDHTVLDMIEHSPIGAVPGTPSYRDALVRLYATHQVYANADHKDCHVTARSLAQRPSFHASNLDALIAGKIEPTALEANAGIFDRYVHSLTPDRRQKAETFRARVAVRPVMHRAKHVGDTKVIAAHDPVHSLFLVPGAGPHPGLPGNYLFGSLNQISTDIPEGAWAIHIHDSDDGAAHIDAPSLPAALEKLQELLASAPFILSEIEALGFRLI